MIERHASIRGRYGIHARPAGAISTVAKKFPETRIVLLDPEHIEHEINAKSVLDILSLNKKCGDELIVRAYGKDEENAAEEVARVIREYEVND
jgi:phosphocarrier protein